MDWDARATLYGDTHARDIADILEAITLESVAAPADPDWNAKATLQGDQVAGDQRKHQEAHAALMAAREAWLHGAAKKARVLRGRPSDRERRVVQLQQETKRVQARLASAKPNWEGYARALVRLIVFGTAGRAFAPIAPDLPRGETLWNKRANRTELERLEPYVKKAQKAAEDAATEPLGKGADRAEHVVVRVFAALGCKRPDNLFSFAAKRDERSAPE